MDRIQLRRIIAAWLLLAAFMPLLVTRTVHAHTDAAGHDEPCCCHHADCCQDDADATDDEHTPSPVDNCPICQFMLPPFEQATVFRFEALPTVAEWQPPLLVEQCRYAAVGHTSSRAPPATA